MMNNIDYHPKTASRKLDFYYLSGTPVKFEDQFPAETTNGLSLLETPLLCPNCSREMSKTALMRGRCQACHNDIFEPPV